MIRTRLQGDTPFFPNMLNNGNVEVCLKKDVDKVIVEKDAEIEELKKQVHDYAQGLYVIQANAEKEACRHKYKRCLAMAKWCRTSARYDESVGAIKYRDWYWKWFKRWLALAEKFSDKEATK